MPGESASERLRPGDVVVQRALGEARLGWTRRLGEGELELQVPRDRDGTFRPQLVKKQQTRLDGFDDKVLSLYARGMSTREIQGHLHELFGTEVSPDLSRG